MLTAPGSTRKGAILVALLSAVAGLVFASGASAAVKIYSPVAQTPRALVFEIDGVVPSTVRAAYAKQRRMGKALRMKISTRKVRRAAKGGALLLRRSSRRAGRIGVSVVKGQRGRRLMSPRMRRSMKSGKTARRGGSGWGKGGKVKVVVDDSGSDSTGTTDGTGTSGEGDGTTGGGTTDGTGTSTAATVPVAGNEPIPAAAYYVSPQGSDSGPGTFDSPWRTLGKAVSSVQPGDTVVLRAGTYGARGTVNYMNRAGTASDPITYRGYPGEAMPTILGFFKITAGYQRFSYMLFDGPTGSVKTPTADNPNGEEVQVSIIGSAVNGIEISHSEIRNSDWHAGLFMSGANDARIVANYIHDNGDETDPNQANLSHGIYWSSGSGLIANNVVEHNLARGIQLYKHPDHVTIANNTVVGNGRAGIQFAEDTADSIAVNNVVTGNEYGIRAHSLNNSSNVVQNNMLWNNSRGDLALTDGLTLIGNRIEDARFMGPKDYRLQQGSPAVDAALSSFAPSSDFASSARPSGAGPDLGAYESH